MKRNNTGYNALRLISISGIKPKTLRLSVLERSPAMRDKLGERKKTAVTDGIDVSCIDRYIYA